MDILESAERVDTILKIRDNHPASLDLEVKVCWLQGLCYFSAVDYHIDPREKKFIDLLARSFSVDIEAVADMLSHSENMETTMFDIVEIINKFNLGLVFLVDVFFVVSADLKSRVSEIRFLHHLHGWLPSTENEKRLYWSVARMLVTADTFDVEIYLKLLRHAYNRSLDRSYACSDENPVIYDSDFAFKTFAAELGYHPGQLMNGIIPGMKLNGYITHIVDYGAFVDIGLRKNALLHISNIPYEIKTELEKGQKVEVTVLDVNAAEEKVSLSMKKKPFSKPRKGYVYNCHSKKYSRLMD